MVHLQSFSTLISVLSCENKEKIHNCSWNLADVDSVAIFAQDMTLKL